MSQGYLNQPYMVYPYLANLDQARVGTQVQLNLGVEHLIATQARGEINAHKVVPSQAKTVVVDEAVLFSQAKFKIIDQQANLLTEARYRVVASSAIHTQTIFNISAAARLRTQVKLAIKVPASDQVSTQAKSQISDVVAPLGTQVILAINAGPTLLNTQTSFQITKTPSMPTQVHTGNMLFSNCGGYLSGPYLMGPYLSDDNQLCGFMRSQVEFKIKFFVPLHTQAKFQIDGAESRLPTEGRSRIDETATLPTMVRFGARSSLPTQVGLLNYNIDRLRVLYDFPSRGVDGLNWVASSTEPGEFHASNLNTDIVQQVWRSASGTVFGVTLVCDTQIAQGIFVDTLGILNHNLTTSAQILWEGANDSGFSSVGFTETIFVQRGSSNILWVSPKAPTNPFRYWRFTISDGSNPAGFLSIGTIVFGSATILVGNDMTDAVTKTPRHWSDKLYTEGFYNAQNDRILTNAIGIRFQSLEFNSGNYQKLVEVFDFVRTDLKALWIPTPRFPYRFGIFAKMSEMPSEEHNVKGETADYITFNVNLDDSL